MAAFRRQWWATTTATHRATRASPVVEGPAIGAVRAASTHRGPIEELSVDTCPHAVAFSVGEELVHGCGPQGPAGNCAGGTAAGPVQPGPVQLWPVQRRPLPRREERRGELDATARTGPHSLGALTCAHPRQGSRARRSAACSQAMRFQRYSSSRRRSRSSHHAVSETICLACKRRLRQHINMFMRKPVWARPEQALSTLSTDLS